MCVCVCVCVAWSQEVVDLCEEFADQGVVAMDIAGPEVGSIVTDTDQSLHLAAFQVTRLNCSQPDWDFFFLFFSNDVMSLWCDVHTGNRPFKSHHLIVANLTAFFQFIQLKKNKK